VELLCGIDQEKEAAEAVIKDKTLLNRLINMRLERAKHCSCERCDDLLAKIHKNTALFIREHNNEQWGLHF
ncbi:hypothetical protein ACSLVN_28145, partial [Klebsiella pneumoniae]|uniref:hypothetical protein n=1 Tax=Klebsiella pneumoniae TaxID=573 RepID=UPI003EE3ECEA